MENHHIFMGEFTINGDFPLVMLNYQREHEFYTGWSGWWFGT